MLLVCGKVNFTNLSRYSELNEKTYRRQFIEEVDFASLNAGLIQGTITQSSERLLVMDCSFLRKSGKATFGLDCFWNGCHSRVERGLEGSLVRVVEVETEVSYGLHAQQTFAQPEMEGVSRMDQYLGHLTLVRPQLPATVQYLAVDGADAKERFITGATRLKLHVVSKLRCDANLRYLYMGVQKQRGRPRKYDGKVDLTDLSRFTFVKPCNPKLTSTLHDCGTSP